MMGSLSSVVDNGALTREHGGVFHEAAIGEFGGVGKNVNFQTQAHQCLDVCVMLAQRVLVVGLAQLGSARDAITDGRARTAHDDVRECHIQFLSLTRICELVDPRPTETKRLGPPSVPSHLV